MLKQLIKFYHISTPATPLKKDKKKLKRLQWATFLSATAGYGIYYVCRLSLNVVKKPIVEEGIFSETELGIIGAVSPMLSENSLTDFWQTAAISGVSCPPDC